jgi:hypothetical protein
MQTRNIVQNVLATAVMLVSVAVSAQAQPPAVPAPPAAPQPPAVASPEVSADRRITFRIHAPHAQNVRLTGTDIPGETHGFDPVVRETPGGHTWLNWRDYLIEFAPLLFQATTAPKS